MLTRASRPEEIAIDDDDLYISIALLAEAGEEEKRNKKKRRGAIPGRTVVPRDRFGSNLRIVAQYFANPPVYNEKFFRRRFRMSMNRFLRIVDEVESHDDYFRQRANAVADNVDDVVRLAESTMNEAFEHFVRAVVEKFGEQYLRAPTVDDTKHLFAINKAKGFPCMLGSKESNTCGRIAQQLGKGCSLNDINVLQRSPLFQRLTSGTSPEVEYEVNGNKYTMGYYLVDGIYPLWATFVKTISCPQGNKKKHFAKVQEAVRKDVERAFGVLQIRFAMVRGPARWWDPDILWYIMTACVILHNMIIDDERGEEEEFDYDQEDTEVLTQEDYGYRDPLLLEEFSAIHRGIKNRQTHEQLRDDLVEHLWELHSSQ
ncbi:uncharacterized protein LOC100822596 [Brachypodium distachyon]|uniref:uncharacterized protein LOC100822596 n=1 Tax=Brachypodium distachyon TaxID=15368 RepID=UPI00052FE96F|nr:uncharacterized protein LOC100822596 [Brachypodium distachyon]|eukprot:XP_014751597.2 uncharacterized protein LOC100822596 [Brachypodium distachyon]